MSLQEVYHLIDKCQRQANVLQRPQSIALDDFLGAVIVSPRKAHEWGAIIVYTALPASASN